MRYHELTNHPAQREKPHCIARLSVYPDEWAAVKTVCAKHGPVQIIAGKQVPLIPVVNIEVLCQDAQTARVVDDEWWTYTETSPHRPHGLDECLEWGKQFNPFPDLPHDWLF